MKIAQALLLRKQLEQKVAQLTPIRNYGEQGLLSTKVMRKNVSDQVDEVTIQTPRVTLDDVTETFDKYATALRKLDASIQKANWEFDVDFADSENPFDKKKD